MLCADMLFTKCAVYKCKYEKKYKRIKVSVFAKSDLKHIIASSRLWKDVS